MRLLLRARGRRGPGPGFRGRGRHPCGQRRARVPRPAGRPRTWETDPNFSQPCSFLKSSPPRILPEYPWGGSVPPGRSVVKAKLLSVNEGKNRQNPDSGHTGTALRLAPLPLPSPPQTAPSRGGASSCLEGRPRSPRYSCVQLTLSHLSSENLSNTAQPSFKVPVSSPFPLFSVFF